LSESPDSMKRRSHRSLITFSLAIVFLLIAVGVVLVSVIAYNFVSLPKTHFTTGTPDAPFEDVVFSSRAHDYLVHAFYMPGQPGAPALISIHGWRSSRHNEFDLARGNDLRKLGYSVLSVDLQDNGGDTVQDGHLSLGYGERWDVLGGMDYLMARGFPSDSIGLVGVSMGATTSLEAAGLDPRLKAVWEDSAYERAMTVVIEQAANYGYPTFVIWPGAIWGFLTTGDRLWEVQPIAYAASFAANKQVIYIVHDEHDPLVLYHHGVDLSAAFQKAGVDVTFWSLPDADLGHAEAVTKYHDEYYRRLDSFFRKQFNWAAGNVF